MKILFFGDVVGEIGLRALQDQLHRWKKKLGADFVIVNGENCCKGHGLTYKEYEALVEAGADAITLGNHWHGRDQIDDYIEKAEHLVRPLNLQGYFHGAGTAVFDCLGYEIQVTNLLGQAFMKETVDAPWDSLEEIMDESCAIHIVDFHADSTSEKRILAELFQGRVSAIIGTHTHVQTADECILQGTGYLSDVGFCGMANGIIGYEPHSIIAALVEKKPVRFAIAEEGPVELDCVLLDIEEETGVCRSIEPIRIIEGKEKERVTHHL